MANSKKYSEVIVIRPLGSKKYKVICDEQVEYQTNHVVIKGESDLLKNVLVIKDANVSKCVDYLLVEKRKKLFLQDILKTITYRILGTSVTFGIGLLSTGNINVAVALGFSDLVLKPLVYFIHERLWHGYKS